MSIPFISRLRSTRLLYSTASLSAFVFDLDGVLVKGNSIIKDADTAIQKLYNEDKQSPKFPICFLTNGGGMTESAKAKELSAKLGVHVRENQVILGHTLVRSIAPKFANLPVLITGKGDIEGIAGEYGFTKAVTTWQLFKAMPSAVPHTPLNLPNDAEKPCPIRDLGYGTARDPFKAVIVLIDPLDWSRDLQLITDVVASNGVPGKHCVGDQQVEIFIAHGDLIWANQFPAPRYGLGAFSLAFQALYRAYTGRDAVITHYGKPTVTPFRLAERLLAEQSGGRQPNKIYMVGDNPAADVRGARAAGPPWTPVLVRTGVFNSSEPNSLQDPADVVHDTVLDFVDGAL